MKIRNHVGLGVIFSLCACTGPTVPMVGTGAERMQQAGTRGLVPVTVETPTAITPATQPETDNMSTPQPQTKDDSL
jgi:hypothetical protein